MNMEAYKVMLILLALVQLSSAARHVVYWDRVQIPSLAEEGLQITLEVDDYMDVLCPYVPTSHIEETRHNKRGQVFLQLFNVTREEYEDCDNRNGIRLQTCDNPGIEKKLTTKFQERSPYPFGFTFRPGSTYYYISKPLHDISKGCTQDTMKMKVNVQKKGAVFAESQHEHTITYNKHNQKHHNGNHNKNIHVATDRVKSPHRHNHHDRATVKPTTRPPRVVIQYETPSIKTPKIRASAVQQDDPENGAIGFNKASLPIISLFASLSTLFLCNFNSNFGFWH
ncbi:uncharacterized protein LOC120332717 [Styela clava]